MLLLSPKGFKTKKFALTLDSNVVIKIKENIEFLLGSTIIIRKYGLFVRLVFFLLVFLQVLFLLSLFNF